MQTNLLWTGREYHSLENCLVTSTNEGFEIASIIIGTYEEKIYRVEYKIRTDHDWRTTFVEYTASTAIAGNILNSKVTVRGIGCVMEKELPSSKSVSILISH